MAAEPAVSLSVGVRVGFRAAATAGMIVHRELA